MRGTVLRLTACGIGLACVLAWPAPASAQWLRYPTAGAPKGADGKPNFAAPAPRTANGKPDLSGIWMTGNVNCPAGLNPETHTCGAELPMGRDGINIGQSLPGGLPYQPALAALVKKRTAENAKTDPHVFCMPDTFQ